MMRALVGAACLTLLGALAGTAAATPPGINGSFALEGGSAPGSIYTAPLAGTPQTRLTFDPSEENDPAWSPDGTRIAFTSRRDGGNAEIYLMNADGSNQQRFTVNGAVDQQPSWSPDGTRIAWSSDRDTNFDIWSANVDGSDLRQLTLNGAIPDTNPEWSPGGSAIAFESSRTGSGDIYRLSPTGTEVDVRRLTSDPSADGSPTWSPDATRIAFDSLRTGGGDIYSVSSAGTAPETDVRRHTNDTHADQDPVWSPDGTRIAFASFRNNADWNLWSVGSTGTETTPLQLTSSVLNELEPAWQTIAPAPVAASLSPAAAGAGSADVAVIVDGSGFVRRSQVRWNGSPRSTQFVSATRLTFVAPAADLAAAGAAKVDVSTSAIGGGTSSGLSFTITALPPPPGAGQALVLTRAKLEPRWAVSRLRGRLSLAGTTTRPALLEARLLRASGKGKALVTRRFRITAAGAFTRRLALIPTLLPGRYIVQVSELATGAGGLTAQRATKLSGPPEGVASRAFVSTKIGGRPLARIAGGPSIIFAHFRLASRPRPGKKLLVRWFGPGSARPVAVTRKPISALVISFIKSSGPLPRGAWRAEMRYGGKLVATAKVRLA